MFDVRKLLFWCVFFLAGCTETTTQTPLQIGINVWPGYAHAFIAQEKGFFKKCGVDVHLVLQRDVSEVTRLYESGDLDGMFNVFTDVVMLNSRGVNTQVVYISDYSDTADLIIGRPELTDLRDLKGKTISFEGINTFSHLFVVKSLEKVGLEEGSYRTLNLLASQVLDSLDKKEIDAGHTWIPTSSDAISKGYKILGKASDIPGLIADILVFRGKTIENRPADIEKVIRALFMAKQFLKNHPDEAILIMAKAEGIPKEEVKSGLQGVLQLNLDENLAAFKTDGTLFKSGLEIINFYMEKGQLAQSLELKNIINPQFLQTIKDSPIND